MENLYIDRMINLYGFEHPIVVEFCRFVETYSTQPHINEIFEAIVKAHEEAPIGWYEE